MNWIMRITKLELKNVGVFAHQVLEFNKIQSEGKAEVHILTGVNGSGKSTILYALACAFIDGPRNLLHPRFRFRSAQGEDQTSEAVIGFDDGDQRLVSFGSNSGKPQYLIQDERYAFAAFAYSGNRSIRSAQVNGIVELTEAPLNRSLDFYGNINSQYLLQWIANTHAKAAFAGQDNQPQKSERFVATLEKIEQAIKRITGQEVEFEFQYDPIISVSVKVDRQYLPLNVLPDGLNAVISWIADLLMRLDRMPWANDIDILDRNFILFLDEIEIHLHPAWQRKILPVVQTLFKNAQIFIATHSPFVVASVSDAWIYKLTVKNGQGTLAEVLEAKEGSSYPTVLAEIFGIDEYFSVEMQSKLDVFYRYRNELMNGVESHRDDFLKLSQELSETSVEINDIVGREIRQLQRITGKEFAL
ncbi:MAG: AAA family ATPase [Rhizobacter sp.]|nr:AAA family ATPase [Chlorobiales bacterium]